MQSPAPGRAALVFAATLVLVSLSVANYVAWLRLHPEVSVVTAIAEKADYWNHVLNMHERAMYRAHGAPESFLPIYDIKNPGFFLLVAELYARAGATTPVPLEITSIILFDLGVIACFFWVYLLFGDLWVAAFATAFLTLSQFFLFFPGMTHTFPFEFFFFNATMLLYLLFLRKDKPIYLYAALATMFITCMNYWFYYMSMWIIMVGLWWQFRGRPRIRDIALISTPPVAAAAFTAAMVMVLLGVKDGAMRLADIFVARTFDARIPGGHWYPNQKFMTAQDWSDYPNKVIRRLEWAYSIDLRWFAIAAGCAAIVLLVRRRDALLSALILLLGGCSWYYVMFQHTHIHHFTGQYSFMAIAPIFGLIAAETIASVRGAWQFAMASASPKAAPTGAVATPVFRAFGIALRSAVAVLMVVVAWMVLSTYGKNTVALVGNVVRTSRTVEVKYREAVASICDRHGMVNLTDLQAASKDWAIDWQPKLIADTNQMPTCR